MRRVTLEMRVRKLAAGMFSPTIVNFCTRSVSKNVAYSRTIVDVINVHNNVRLVPTATTAVDVCLYGAAACSNTR